MSVAVSRLAPPRFPRLQAPAQGRDLALDVVRSWSLIVVVIGHFIMQIVWWPPGGEPVSSNTLSSGNLWPFATWLLQVMPLFFIAGGAVNRGSWERFTGSWPSWVWQRVSRLMRPTVVFLAAMAVMFTGVTVLVPRAVTDPLVAGITGPLWFLAVYIPVSALTPLTSRWHSRHKWVAVLALGIAIAATDFMRLSVFEPLGVLNLLLAWVFVQQLGYWYADGISRWAAWLLVAGGLAFNVVVTQVADLYPTSLVGLPTEDFSNMAPPDAVLVSHSLVLLGIFVLTAPLLRRWFSRPLMLRATAIAGMTAMTLYLWHMFVLVAWTSFLHAVGLSLPVRLEGELVVPDGAYYWLWLVPSTAGYAVAVWTLVRYLWPIEYMRLPLFDSQTARAHQGAALPAAGIALVSVGLLMVSGAGLSGFPFAVHTAFGIPVSCAAGMLAVLAGLLLVRQPVPEREVLE